MLNCRLVVDVGGDFASLNLHHSAYHTLRARELRYYPASFPCQSSVVIKNRDYNFWTEGMEEASVVSYRCVTSSDLK